MDGRTIYQYGTKALGGIAAADKRFFWDCLDKAAIDFVRKTRCRTGGVDITTVADQQAYDLPADFIAPLLKNRNERYFAKVYDGSNYYWPVLTSFEKIFRENLTTSKDTPSRWALRDKPAVASLVTGTATGAGAASGGRCTLTNTGATFLTTVEARDIIHNTEDGSSGVVLSVTDDTHLVCALFDGTDNDVTDGDAYIITPAPGFQIYLDAPSKTAGHTFTLPYVCMPTPVYSDYDVWGIPPQHVRAICYEGAFLFVVDYDEDIGRFEDLHKLYLEELRDTNRERAQRRLQGGRYSTRS